MENDKKFIDVEEGQVIWKGVNLYLRKGSYSVDALNRLVSLIKEVVVKR